MLGPEGLLLVQNLRRDGRTDWSPPGGVIDAGEGLIEGLTREVREETGLEVTEWSDPVYLIETTAPDLGWHLRVQAHVAVAYSGEILIDDPDGIVIDARFVEIDHCGSHLSANHPWVREPLVDWLTEQWAEARSYGYRVDGPMGQTMVSRSW